MDVAPGLSRVGPPLLSRSTVVLLPARAYLLAPTMNESLDPSPPNELFVGEEMKSSPAESL
jgi:hypothetical protein